MLVHNLYNSSIFVLNTKFMKVQHNILIKNPSKKILDLMAQIAKDKAAKQAELRARWENGTIENVEVVK